MEKLLAPRGHRYVPVHQLGNTVTAGTRIAHIATEVRRNDQFPTGLCAKVYPSPGRDRCWRPKKRPPSAKHAKQKPMARERLRAPLTTACGMRSASSLRGSVRASAHWLSLPASVR